MNNNSKSLNYYYNNKEEINIKRRLKYKLEKGKISKFRYNLELQKINNKDYSNLDEEKMNEIIEIFTELDYTELKFLSEEINSLIKNYY